MAAVRRLWAFTAGPDYPADPADRRTVTLVGLRLPVRASVAIAVVTFALLFDYSRTFIPGGANAGRGPDAMLATSIERVVLFGLLPLLIVLFGFRDRPSRYGLTIGDWRWGAALVLVGCAVMTPIVLALAGAPDFRAYYAPSNDPLPSLLATNVMDLVSTEFIYRGFLMLCIARVFGPIGLVVALFPFTFTHLTKPELELLSTFAGGAVYGWLTWRTGSILWGALAHVYIVTLIIVASATWR